MSTSLKNPITLIADLTEDERQALALYLKRTSFEKVLRHTDNNNDTEMAYTMIGALEGVRRALAEHGYCPR